MKIKDRIELLERKVARLHNGVEELEYRERKNKLEMYYPLTGQVSCELNPNVALLLILDHLGMEIKHNVVAKKMAGYTIVPKVEKETK